MKAALVAALGLASLVAVVPRVGHALTLGDCENWLAQVEGEVSGVAVSGADGGNERDALLQDLRAASADDAKAKPSAALKSVDEFKKRAARLAAEGRIGRVEGDRLDNLSDTVRHCIQQVESE